MVQTAPLQSTSEAMRHRVPLDFIGNHRASDIYGGKLDAWSFVETEGEAWLRQFRSRALESIGKTFLPVYRMADGEYRFLMGRRFNPHRKPLIEECLAYLADKSGLRNENKWSTSWGESYAPDEVKKLQQKYLADIAAIAQKGILAMYINDNGLNAFVEYNSVLLPYLAQQGISLNAQNYIPFHFPCQMLTSDGWQDFYKGRHLLIVTGLDDQKEEKIRRTLAKLSVASVQFLAISSNQSMQDTLDLSKVSGPVDMCLVAAGIGASNIVSQLEPLQTLSIDIGGLMSCFEDPSKTVHAGTFSLQQMNL